MLQFENVTFAYSNCKILLKNLSFTLAKGTTLGILGESGSGKSTIAKLLCGFYRPSSGKISLSGSIQMIFQNPTGSLNPRWTIREILEEPLRIHGIKKHPETLLQEVGLSPDLLNRTPGQLSGGQCQRVAIARALSFQPDFLIADESTSSLDRKSEKQVLELLKAKQLQEGFGLIVISHNPDVIRLVTDHVIVLKGGDLIETGTTNAVFAMPATDYTRLLLQE